MNNEELRKDRSHEQEIGEVWGELEKIT